MYKFVTEHKNFLKYSSIAFFGCSAGWVYFQIKRTQYILNNALDTSLLHMSENVLQKEEFASESIIEIQPFFEYKKAGLFSSLYESIKFAYARRLLALAKSDNKEYRLKAIKQLAKVHYLSDWHCSLLANMIDSRTAVGLARTEHADRRLILDPPFRYHNYSNVMLVNAMHEFLVTLYEKSQHPCLAYFLSKVFVYEQDSGHIVDHDSSSLELKKFLQTENDVVPLCLESLMHHTAVEKYSCDIAYESGLPLLMEIHRRFKDDLNVTIKLCNILSFMCFNRDLLELIHQSGWISVLADWVNHNDVRISVPAARALANLDSESNEKYSRDLYLLHPTKRKAKESDIDVVFIHGLLGGVFFTWRQRNKANAAIGIIDEPIRSTRQFLKNWKEQLELDDLSKDYEVVMEDIPINANVNSNDALTCSGCDFELKNYNNRYTACWPKDWLGEDLKNAVRIIGINYDTSLSMWAPICPSEKVKLTLEERSDYMLERLVESGIGKKPIVWVTHSMGGLIVKNILVKAFDCKNPRYTDICNNTKGVVFYSTPHNGSKMANLSQATALVLWPSVEVCELRENSPKLKDIHTKFLKLAKILPIKIVTFVETKSTIMTAMKFNFLLVEPESGNPGIGEYYEVPQDHLGICKPVNRYSFLYQKLLHLLKDVLKESKKQEKPAQDLIAGV